MKREKTISELVKDYLENNCSIEEVNRLFDYFGASNDEQLIRELIRKNLDADFVVDQRMESILKNTDRAIMTTLAERKNRQATFKWYGLKFWGYAAAAVLIFVTGGIIMMGKTEDKGLVKDVLYGYKNDVLPGGEKAILELSDGKKVILKNESQEFYEKDGTKIKTNGGELVYQNLTADRKDELNKLVTPKAGMYRVVLADGTRVWLNAMSELTYPVKFDQHERRVTLKGEAYFDVAKDKMRPFKVDANGTEIEALGTSFNVQAYQTAIVATLIEGSIKVVNEKRKAILKPGQQAFIQSDSPIKVNDSDTEKNVAWKEGDFYFNMDSMSDMMNEIARWYDLEIVYKGQIPDKKYTGGIGRQANLSEVLEMLKTVSGAKFEINKRKLTVDFETN